MQMIKKYQQLFTSLHTAHVKGFNAPHKAVLLLSILELIEFEILQKNELFLSEDLIDAYSYIWKRYVGNSSVFQKSISQPFWYMNSEPFWTLYHRNGGKVLDSERKPSESVLKTDYYGMLAPELYLLLQDVSVRAALRVTLISKYLVTQGDAAEIDNAYLPDSAPIHMAENMGRVRSKAPGLYVHLPNGETIHERFSSQTLIRAIQLVGPAKVASLGMICCGIPLVSKDLDPKYTSDQEAIGNGYYMVKKSNTGSKVRYLNTISKAFNLGWTVEIVPEG